MLFRLSVVVLPPSKSSPQSAARHSHPKQQNIIECRSHRRRSAALRDHAASSLRCCSLRSPAHAKSVRDRGVYKAFSKYLLCVSCGLISFVSDSRCSSRCTLDHTLGRILGLALQTPSSKSNDTITVQDTLTLSCSFCAAAEPPATVSETAVAALETPERVGMSAAYVETLMTMLTLLD